MSDPFSGKGPQDGLHVLKDFWTQKSYLQDHCQCLLGSLDQAIKATEEAAPVRTQGYQLDRAETLEIDVTQRERLWERSMYRRWNCPNLSPVGSSWSQLVAFQVPLFDCQDKDGWRYIEHLGIRSNGTPCVVELKREPSASPLGRTEGSETPLRIVLEAAAYAIALRKNWDVFRTEFVGRLKQLTVPASTIERVPSSLTQVGLVCAAPASFWIDWLPVTDKGCSEFLPEAWRAFTLLLNAFEKKQLPVSFVSISGDAAIPGSLAAQPFQKFPIITEALVEP